ncbi:MAG: tetratricopeptide repeat protein [Candidatus Sabulitectum sp.]|nr:tetratricopeptide repeat protein [Candidatus Sabulitectum sp.]
MSLAKILVSVVVGLLVVAACSSPAVTGIKVHIQNSEYQDAIHLADSVIANGEGSNPEVWYWKARAHSMMRVWDEAAESFVQAYELDPLMAANMANYWPAFYNTAAGYIEEGRLEDAVSMLQTGGSIVPERPEFDQMLGDIALNEGNYDEAIAKFESSIELAVVQIDVIQESIAASEDPAWIEQLNTQRENMVHSVVLSTYNTGAILKNLYMNSEDETEAAEQMAEAVQIYTRGIEIDPSSADLMTGLAEFYILSEQYDDALAIYDSALIAIDTGVEEGWISEEDAADMKAGVLLTRGFTFIEMDRFDEGIAALEQCRAQMGNTYQVLAMIGHANFTMEKYNESIEVMEQLTVMDGLTNDEYANAWYMMYANYIRLEEDTDALQAMQNAIEYDPDNADYYELLAQTYSTLGRNNQAMEAMAKAQSLR